MTRWLRLAVVVLLVFISIELVTGMLRARPLVPAPFGIALAAHPPTPVPPPGLHPGVSGGRGPAASRRSADSPYLLYLGLLVMGSTGISRADGCQKILLPAYFDPPPLWPQALAAAPTVNVIILNPASGPGVAIDPSYAAALSQAHDVEIIGYVDTAYGRRDRAVVKAEIDKYRAWYGVAGIFLDEVASDADSLPYYRDLAAYIRARPGRRVVLNPGTFPDEGYMQVGDTVGVFEGSYGDYVGLQQPEWISRYPMSKFVHFVYRVSASNMAEVVNLALRRNAGNVFVTDAVMPNPYGTLPSYWGDEVRLVAACGK